jgi:hypothetical protein
MATTPQQEAVYKEGRLQLAKQSIAADEFQSRRAAAISYDVNKDTLKRRIAGIPPRRGTSAKNRLLLPTEERYLIQQILSMDKRGLPPSVTTIREMASLLASQHGSPVTAGKY